MRWLIEYSALALSFFQELRFLARKQGNVKVVPHNEIFEKIKTFIDNQDTVISPIRHGETDENADMLYFAGCLPFLDKLFSDIGFSGTKIIEDTVSLLNAFEIIPDVMYGCCGHDAFWNGDNELFEYLKNKNIERIMKKKPKTIIFSCPECYRTLKLIYPEMHAYI